MKIYFCVFILKMELLYKEVCMYNYSSELSLTVQINEDIQLYMNMYMYVHIYILY